MAKLKLKVAKSGRVNPQTKAKGFAARVITNGTAGYEDIVAEACHNTTLHMAEAKVALELAMRDQKIEQLEDSIRIMRAFLTTLREYFARVKMFMDLLTTDTESITKV